MNEKVKNNPVAYGDIVKSVTVIANFLVAANYLSPEDPNYVIPVATLVLTLLINLGIMVLQRANVTPWNDGNPNVIIYKNKVNEDSIK